LRTFELEKPIASQPATLIKRITRVLRDREIEKAFYQIFPPNEHADEVIAWWLSRNRKRSREHTPIGSP
jgi:peroxiredoxin